MAMRGEPAGRVVLLTGGTDGMGRRLARELAARGYQVLLHGRDDARGAVTIAEVEAATGVRPRWYRADLASLDEVRALGRSVLDEHGRLDVLVNNAAVGPVGIEFQRRESRDGRELCLAVNYLAPVVLTRTLVPLLVASAPSRIVNVASVGQAPLDFGDLELAARFDPLQAYRQSKFALIMFTFDLAEELRGTGVTANAVHPATLMATSGVPNDLHRPGALEEGLAAVLRAVGDEQLATTTGRYFEGVDEARALDQAYDPAARAELRRLTEDLVASGR